MTAAEFLAKLRERGGELSVRPDGGLRYVGPEAVLTDKVRAFCEAKRLDLVAVIDPFRPCPGCPGVSQWVWSRTGLTMCARCNPVTGIPVEEIRWADSESTRQRSGLGRWSAVTREAAREALAGKGGSE